MESESLHSSIPYPGIKVPAGGGASACFARAAISHGLSKVLGGPSKGQAWVGTESFREQLTFLYKLGPVESGGGYSVANSARAKAQRQEWGRKWNEQHSVRRGADPPWLPRKGPGL